jgi:5-(carboxyamino)imidazole ribonucleotide synthase
MKVAIVGTGQLARMLALAGMPLGLSFTFIQDNPQGDTSPVDGLGHIVPWSADIDNDVFYAALGNPDTITFEKEQVDARLFSVLAKFQNVYPSADVLSVCADRYQEKQLLDGLNIPNAKFCFANNSADLKHALQTFTLPAVVKSTTEGYDGKNQWRLHSVDDIDLIPASAISKGVIAEEFIRFTAEASLVGVRGRDGDMKFYPPTENVHSNGILARSFAPARCVDENMAQAMQDHLAAILEHKQYVGVMAAEFFITPDGILVNELAPRVHNSGHWTQQGALASQFENHMRAVMGLPLGSTAGHKASGMVNIIGEHDAPRHLIAANSSLHWYNKLGKPGRKIGHINLVSASIDELCAEMEHLQAQLPVQ